MESNKRRIMMVQQQIPLPVPLNSKNASPAKVALFFKNPNPTHPYIHPSIRQSFLLQ